MDNFDLEMGLVMVYPQAELPAATCDRLSTVSGIDNGLLLRIDTSQVGEKNLLLNTRPAVEQVIFLTNYDYPLKTRINQYIQIKY